MRRHAIGIIALVLLLGAVVLSIWRPQGAGNNFTLGALVRVGAVMAVLWLAYPDVKRLPPWIWATFPVLLMILAVRPRWLVVAVPLVIALAILKPRLSARR